jgi:hypothetical protein
MFSLLKQECLYTPDRLRDHFLVAEELVLRPQEKYGFLVADQAFLRDAVTEMRDLMSSITTLINRILLPLGKCLVKFHHCSLIEIDSMYRGFVIHSFPERRGLVMAHYGPLRTTAKDLFLEMLFSSQLRLHLQPDQEICFEDSKNGLIESGSTLKDTSVWFSDSCPDDYRCVTEIEGEMSFGIEEGTLGMSIVKISSSKGITLTLLQKPLK